MGEQLKQSVKSKEHEAVTQIEDLASSNDYTLTNQNLHLRPKKIKRNRRLSPIAKADSATRGIAQRKQSLPKPFI